jgi:DNA repair exonuclease SbcCD ATPase subunit
MALQVQLDAFTKVKKAIDDMVAELKSQQEEEVKHKAFCTKELNTNEKQTYTTQVEIADLKDKIAALEDTIEKLVKAIAAAKEDIAEMEIELKKASEQREAENKAFQEEVMDQRTMQNILEKAIARLKAVYKKKAEALAQESQSQTPPEQFQPYAQHAGGTKVVSFIEQIVEDSKAVEKELMANEASLQTTYETFANDSTSAIKSLRASIEAKTKTKAATEVEKEEAAQELSNTEDMLESLETYAADLHGQCDFVLKNFDVRQKARLQEIEALQSAKALLSGMQDDDDLS